MFGDSNDSVTIYQACVRVGHSIQQEGEIENVLDTLTPDEVTVRCLEYDREDGLALVYSNRYLVIESNYREHELRMIKDRLYELRSENDELREELKESSRSESNVE